MDLQAQNPSRKCAGGVAAATTPQVSSRSGKGFRRFRPIGGRRLGQRSPRLVTTKPSPGPVALHRSERRGGQVQAWGSLFDGDLAGRQLTGALGRIRLSVPSHVAGRGHGAGSGRRPVVAAYGLGWAVGGCCVVGGCGLGDAGIHHAGGRRFVLMARLHRAGIGARAGLVCDAAGVGCGDRGVDLPTHSGGQLDGWRLEMLNIEHVFANCRGKLDTPVLYWINSSGVRSSPCMPVGSCAIGPSRPSSLHHNVEDWLSAGTLGPGPVGRLGSRSRR